MANAMQGDVVVVGGGLAGLCATLELLDAGRQVLLFDRDEPAALGGLARESFGGMFLVDTPEQRRAGLRDSVQQALADWMSFGELGADETWPRAWAEHYVTRCTAEVGGWLRERGVRYFSVPGWAERGLGVPGNSVPRFHIVWGTGQGLVDALLDRLETHPRRSRLQIHFGHRVEHLVAEGGRVVGLTGVREHDGQGFQARGGAVVVAAGGINGSLARVRAHWHADWGQPPATLLNGSHRFADGTLHDAVRQAGGRLTHLDRMWNYAAGVHHPRPRKPAHGLSLVPPRSALWLDAHGRRITPPLVTGFDTRDLVAQVCARPPGYSWQLLNRRIALKELAVSGAEFNPAVRDRRLLAFLRDLLLGNRWLYREMVEGCEDFVRADTLPELVQRMNALTGQGLVEEAAVRAAAEAWDAELAKPEAERSDPQWKRIEELRRWKGDRIRTCKRQPLLDPKAGPLIAIREHIISRKSLGGIQTDLESRVLGRDGAPIPGLFAAGEAAGFGGGGMHGLRALEGTFLGGCVLGGRIAGRGAAAIT